MGKASFLRWLPCDYNNVLINIESFLLSRICLVGTTISATLLEEQSEVTNVGLHSPILIKYKM